MRATSQQFGSFLDAMGKLRRLNLQATFLTSGWNLPPRAGEAVGIPQKSIDRDTLAELEELRKYFHSLRNLQPLSGLDWPRDAIEQAAEASRLLGFLLATLFDEPAGAAAAYRVAAADFREANQVAKSSDAEAKAKAAEDAASGNIVAEIAAARGRADSALPGSLEAAEGRIALGEMLVQADNTFEARAELKLAEAAMTAAGYSEPPSGHSALYGLIGSMVSGEAGVGAVQNAGNVLKVRLLFYRLYKSMTLAQKPSDPAEAARYSGMIDKHQLLSPR